MIPRKCAGAKLLKHESLILRLGHLLDVAMSNIGFGPDVMVPAKGLHTPEQGYVEYTGKVEGLDKEKLMADLKVEMNKLVAAGGVTSSVGLTTVCPSPKRWNVTSHSHLYSRSRLTSLTCNDTSRHSLDASLRPVVSLTHWAS